MLERADLEAEARDGRIDLLLARQMPHLGFGQIPHGKQCVCQGLLSQQIQEIGLVFGTVARLEQAVSPRHLINPRIVAGGNSLPPEREGVIQKSPEFDLFVTQHVRVGCAARTVFGQEIAEHPIPVFSGKIHGVKWNPEMFANRTRHLEIFLRGTMTRGIVFLPVFHEQACNLVPLAF